VFWFLFRKESVVSVRTENSRKRSGHRSLVAAYLAVAVAVVGLVVSRGTQPRDTQTPAESTTVAPVVAAPVVAAAAPVRLTGPEVFATPPIVQTGKPTPAPTVTDPNSKGVDLAPTVSQLTADSAPIEESAELDGVDLAAVPVEIKPAPVLNSEPELSLPSWSEQELLASLSANSFQLDLHSGSPSLEEARAQVKSIAEEFAHFGERFDRKADFLKRLRRDPGDVLPGEQDLVEESGPRPPEHVIESWVAARPDLQGLPLRLDDSCKLEPQRR